MDISVNTNFGYTAQLAYSQPSTPVVRAENTPTDNAQSRGSQTASAGPQGSNAQANAASTSEKQLQELRKKNPAADVTAKPGYSFEIDQKNHKIMKVNDSKGVLIYQVPSKGQLALIEAEEGANKGLKLTA